VSEISTQTKISYFASPEIKGKYLLPPEECRYELPYQTEFPNLVYLDRLRNEKWFTPMHVHDYFEMCYVAKGNGWFILDGVKHSAAEGDLFVTKPHEVHCGGASGNGQFKMYSMGFHFEGYNELETDFFMLGPNRVVKDTSGNVPAICEQMMTEFEIKGPYSTITTRSYWTLLLSELLRSYINTSKENLSIEHTIQPFIKSALSFIHRYYNRNLSVPELAKASGVSRSHLDREFKQLLGITPGEYVRQLQLERAKQMLRLTQLSVTSIAEDLGFDSVQAFCMFFKRHCGLRPKEYKKHVSRNLSKNEQKR
jgi:AraC-like DNA-binding protein